MARRVTMSAKEALMEVNQWDLSESESDDDDLDLTMDESIFDDSDSGPMDTNIESSGSSEEDSDSSDSSCWSAWRSNDPDFAHFPFTVQYPGVHFPSQPESELEAPQHFLTDKLLMALVTATNAYAVIKLSGKALSKNSVWCEWNDETLIEMKANLGVIMNMAMNVIMNMAMNDKPDVKIFFSRNCTQYCLFFLDIFSQQHFLQIHWMFHMKLLEPTTAPITRGGRIHHFVNYFQKKCLELFTPGKNVAVDESTVKYEGQIIFKTYNPQKPTKWGMRVCIQSDCETGCISCFKSYFRQPTTDVFPRPGDPFTTRIVIHLVDQLATQTEGAGYHIYTDRFYTSPALAVKLLEEGMHAIGTVQKNHKGVLEDLKRLHLKNHATKVYQHSSKMLMALG